MTTNLKAIIVASCIGFVAFGGGYLFAQANTDHSPNAAHQHGGSQMPKEAGQSAFAAIAEIVQLLNSDPKTDWSKVNIAALRTHLVDMNALTLGAEVQPSIEGETIRFAATGETPMTIRALQNMVPAHAKELDKLGAWTASGDKTDTGATLTIQVKSKQDLLRVQALGFFGLMATGAHHQPHHLAMASGERHH